MMKRLLVLVAVAIAATAAWKTYGNQIHVDDLNSSPRPSASSTAGGQTQPSSTKAPIPTKPSTTSRAPAPRPAPKLTVCVDPGFSCEISIVGLDPNEADMLAFVCPTKKFSSERLIRLDGDGAYDTVFSRECDTGQVHVTVTRPDGRQLTASYHQS